MKPKTTTQVLGELTAYLEYAKTWKEARVHVLIGAIEKIEEMRRALDEVEDLEKELSVRSYGFGDIVRKVT